MDVIAKITEELKVQKWQVEAAVKLIDEGNTIPFISRYRKEVTGSLNDEQLRNLHERLVYLRNLEEKKEQVLSSINEQGKLTPELEAKIKAAETMVTVEDLYRPYRPKRKTRASVAKEKGLDGLAEYLLAQNATEPLEKEAEKYVTGTDVPEEKQVKNVAEALQGAKDIIAESISDDAEHRLYIRNATYEEGIVTSVAKDEKQESVYEMYYNFSEPVKKLAGHRVLALNRGEAEKILTVKIEAPTERILRYLEKKIITSENEFTTPALKEVCQDSYERLIAPAIEREIRSDLTEKAEDGAIDVFGKNLEQLLMQPPIAGKVVLGWDPAFRTGCKLAIVDATGKVLDTKVIYPTAPQNKVDEAKAELKKLIKKYNVDLISVGNGTASRESEQVIVELLKELDRPVQYVIVNEAGASVYSASKLATEEFPQFDVGQRSAASIARRLQDPLAELVKIDPKSIGVGQYQHDMNQKKLDEALGGVVESSVNKVGVDVNTASAPLLEYISGINKTIANTNILSTREAFFVVKDAKNAKVYINEELVGTVDNDGVLYVENYEEKCKNISKEFNYIEIKSDNEKSLIFDATFDLFQNRNEYYYDADGNRIDTSENVIVTRFNNGYLYHDRPVYKVGEDIHFWGYARNRVYDVKDARLKIFVDSNLVAEEKLKLNKLGCFEYTYNLSDVNPDSYIMAELYVNKKFMSSRYIKIEDYSTRKYVVDIQRDGNEFIAGDSSTISVSANTYDGIPLSDTEFKINESNASSRNVISTSTSNITTDMEGNGTSKVEFKLTGIPTRVYSESHVLRVENSLLDGGEEYLSYYVYPYKNSADLKIDYDKEKGEYKLSVKEYDVLKTDKPANDKIIISATARYDERVVDKVVYDEYTKENRTIYKTITKYSNENNKS